MTNDWLIQQLDELSEKSEYQDRALLYEIKTVSYTHLTLPTICSV